MKFWPTICSTASLRSPPFWDGPSGGRITPLSTGSFQSSRWASANGAPANPRCASISPTLKRRIWRHEQISTPAPTHRNNNSDTGKFESISGDRRGEGREQRYNKIIVASENKGGASAMRPEITLIKKSGPNPVMSKCIFLDAEGKVCSDGSQCLMAQGTATRAAAEKAADLAGHIMACGSGEAIALGALRADLVSPANITT